MAARRIQIVEETASLVMEQGSWSATFTSLRFIPSFRSRSSTPLVVPFYLKLELDLFCTLLSSILNIPKIPKIIMKIALTLLAASALAQGFAIDFKAPNEVNKRNMAAAAAVATPAAGGADAGALATPATGAPPPP